MSQDTLILAVRILALLFVLLIFYVIWRVFSRVSDEAFDHPKHRGSALDPHTLLPPDEQDGFEISVLEGQRTQKLNKGFFGSRLGMPPAAAELPNAPTADLPVAVMARLGQHFSGEDVKDLVRTFGFTRSPAGTYEIINKNGRDVLFTMLNIHAPGTFAQDLENMDPIEGVLLVLQLPNGSDALESFETLVAMVNDMCEQTGGRLCDFQRRPFGPKDLMAYRSAAEQFQKEYDAWLAAHQRRPVKA